MKRHEVQVLRRAGVPSGKVAEVTGVSRRSIRRIAKEPPIESASDEELAQGRRVGRPSRVAALRPWLVELLSKEPELPSVEVLHRARGEGYAGGKSALYELVRSLRPSSSPLLVRFEGLPGEFSQHDFGEVDVRYANGSKERLHFFASRLKYSRMAHVELVEDETVERLVRALLSSFERFGGVPLVGVFDNPKTIVRRRQGSKIEWNPTFGQVALDYRFAPELCTPRRAQEKGAVENLVGWVKGSFFKVRRFHDRADLLAQLEDWHVEVNTKRPSRATGVVPCERMLEERPRLRPLAIPPAEYPLRFSKVVGPTARVEHDRIRYMMPPASIGFPATLYLYPDRVRIVAGRYEVEHARWPEAGDTCILPDQRIQALAEISGARGQLYYKRQEILDLGREAEAMLTEIVHRHPRTWQGEVEILFDLLQEFGQLALKRALQEAIDERLYSAHSVALALRRYVG